MPNLPDNVESVIPEKSPTPIVDDPKTLEELYGIEDPTPTPEPDWAKPVNELASGQKTLQEGMSKLIDAIAAMADNRQVSERVIERPVAQPREPEAPAWTGKVKPEQAEFLREAVTDIATQLFEDYKANDLAPSLGYLTQTQEMLLEDHLVGKYPDEDFGFKALKDKAKQVRQAYNYQIPLEEAFQKVAFLEMNQNLGAARAAQSTKVAADKRGLMADSPGHVGESVRDQLDEGTLTPEERHLARVFFEGNDPRTRKPRSQKEMEVMWVEHRRGAKRDMMAD